MQSFDSLPTTQAGDLVLLVSPTNKKIITRLNTGEQIHTHRGILYHDQLIGVAWGSEIATHTGSTYILLKPSLHDLLLETKRSTQIMYPKDIGYVLLKLGIGEGQIVIEAGSGSGALTTAFAWYIGNSGKIISYDVNENAQNLARKNLARLGLEDRVIFKNRDIANGFDETNADALFLDVPNPQDYMTQVSKALKRGGNFGAILPTTNQVSRLLNEFYRFQFGFVEVCEILIRYYKPVAERLRPTDRMVAHTGYLIFARPFTTSTFPEHHSQSTE